MTEVWFYHLERSTLDEVLPELLEKTLARGWRALVRAGTAERLAALDTHLWTYRDNSFLPHGPEGEDHPERQPILLTTGEARPNDAEVIFLVDGAAAPPLEPYLRCVDVFDGRDPSAVEAARARWRAARAAGHGVTYWQQGAGGRWEKKA